VILITLTLGILIPDIEFVLGMVGSTIGSAICIIFPALMFIKLTTKNTTERLAAQFVLVVGVVMMIVGTYSNLQEANRSMDSIMEEKNLHIKVVEESLLKTPAPVLPTPVLSYIAVTNKSSVMDGVDAKGKLGKG
jgi:hypothetical protein